MLEAGDAIRAAARKQGYAEREVLVAGQGFRWSELQSGFAGNLSLFGASKLVDLRIPNGKPGRDGGEALQRYVRHLDDGVVTLVTLPELDWATRRPAGSPPSPRLASPSNSTPRARAACPTGSPSAWPPAAAASRRPRLHRRPRRGQPARRPPGDPQARPAPPPGDLSLDDVRGAVPNVARYTLDKLRQALLDGDPARCARLLEGLKGEGEAPLLVLVGPDQRDPQPANLRQGIDDGQPLPALLKAERVFDERRKQGMQRVPRLPPQPCAPPSCTQRRLTG